MTTAITADGMLAALKKWGIAPKFYKADWRTHNRNAQQGWGPINGLVVHNFGSDTSDPNSLAYLYNGDLARGMPGPLSQFAITDDGTVWVIGWGTANHTGFMDKDLHALVLKDAAPLDRDFKPDASGSNPSAGAGQVNPHYIGVEMTYGAASTAAQRKSVALLGAALMDLLGPGYTGGSVVGHRECTTQRSDPVGVPMWLLRRDVNALLKARAEADANPPTPAPEEDPMPTPAELWSVPFKSPADGKSYAASSWLVMANVKAGEARAIASQALAQVAALTAAFKAATLNPNMTPEQITAAAKAGADAALDERISDADVTLNVTPPSA